MEKKVVLFCDDTTIEFLLNIIPKEFITCIVGASNRPNSLKNMQNRIIKNQGVKFLIQPKYNSEDYKVFLDNIENISPTLLLCYSYSMILRNDLRKIFDYNCINLHGALLPKNRGPNPVQWAIIKGEKKTGATLHYMDDTIDTGAIIAQKEVHIDIHDTWVSLFDKVKDVSEKLLKEQIKNILNDKLVANNQNEASSSTNFRLNENYPKIDFKKMTNNQIYNLIRGQVSPLKGAYIDLENGTKKYIDTMISFDEIERLRVKYEK